MTRLAEVRTKPGVFFRDWVGKSQDGLPPRSLFERCGTRTKWFIVDMRKAIKAARASSSGPISRISKTDPVSVLYVPYSPLLMHPRTWEKMPGARTMTGSSIFCPSR